MKSLAVMIGLCVAAVAVFFFLTRHVSVTCEELLGMNEELKQAAIRGDCGEAKPQIDRLQSRWEELSADWEMLCHHDDLNLVTSAIARAAIYCEQGDASNLEVECAYIEVALATIRNKERIEIQNIL